MAENSPPPAPPAGPARPPRRRLRIVLVAAGALLLLLAVLTALLPTILSSGRVRRMVEREATTASGLRVSLGALDVGWSEAGARGIVVRTGPGEGDPVLLEVDEVRVGAGIPMALRSRYDLPVVAVSRPVVRLDLPELTKPPSAQVAAVGGPASAQRRGGEEPPATPFSMKVEIREGTLLQVGLDGKESRLGSFSADVAASSDAPAKGTLDLDLGEGGKVRLGFTAHPFRNGRAVPGDRVEAALEATLEALDLSRIREAVCALGEVRFDRMEGRATGTISASTVSGESFEDGKAKVRVRDFALAGPDLGEGLVLEEPEASIDTSFRIGKDNSIEFHDAIATVPGIQAQGDLTVTAANALVGKLAVKGSLAEMPRRLRSCGLAANSTFGGTFSADLRASGDAKSQTLAGRIRADSLSVSGREGRPGVEEPRVEADFHLVLGSDGTLELKSGKFESGHFHVVEAILTWKDGLRKARGGGMFPLDRFGTLAAACGVELPADLRGSASFHVEWPTNAGGPATASIDVRDLAFTPRGGRPGGFVDPRLQIGIRALPGDKEIRVESLYLKGKGIDVRASGTCTPDLSRGNLASLEADLDLEKVAGLADAFGAALPFRLKGAAAWKGPISWKGDFGTVEAGFGALALRGLEVTLPATGTTPARTLREEAVDVGLDASATTTREGTALVLRRFAASGGGVDLAASGTLDSGGASDLKVEGSGDLGAILETLSDAGLLPPAKGAAGKATLLATAKAPAPGDPLALLLDVSVEGLRYPDPKGGPSWEQKTASVKGDVAWDRRKDSFAGDLVLRTDDGTATVKGSLSAPGSPRRADATADLDLDLSGLCRSRPDLMPLPGMVVGRVKGTAEVHGPLGDPLDVAALTGKATLELDSVKTEPMELRDAHVEAVLGKGVLDAPKITATVNGGTLKASASLGLQGGQAPHSLDLHASGVRIDRAMSYLLKEIVPLFAVGESGSLTGALRIDLRLDGQGPSWEEVKKNLRGKGGLEVSEGTVLGGGIAGEILEFFGKGKGLPFSTVAAEFSVQEQRVKNENLTLDGKETSLVLRGSTTFDGKLDYRVGARSLLLGKKRFEKLKVLLDEEGNLPFGIGGTLSKPRVKPPDLRKLLGNAAEDLLKRKLRDLLGGDD